MRISLLFPQRPRTIVGMRRLTYFTLGMVSLMFLMGGYGTSADQTFVSVVSCEVAWLQSPAGIKKSCGKGEKVQVTITDGGLCSIKAKCGNNTQSPYLTFVGPPSDVKELWVCDGSFTSKPCPYPKKKKSKKYSCFLITSQPIVCLFIGFKFMEIYECAFSIRIFHRDKCQGNARTYGSPVLGCTELEIHSLRS